MDLSSPAATAADGAAIAAGSPLLSSSAVEDLDAPSLSFSVQGFSASQLLSPRTVEAASNPFDFAIFPASPAITPLAAAAASWSSHNDPARDVIASQPGPANFAAPAATTTTATAAAAVMDCDAMSTSSGSLLLDRRHELEISRRLASLSTSSSPTSPPPPQRLYLPSFVSLGACTPPDVQFSLHRPLDLMTPPLDDSIYSWPALHSDLHASGDSPLVASPHRSSSFSARPEARELAPGREAADASATEAESARSQQPPAPSTPVPQRNVSISRRTTASAASAVEAVQPAAAGRWLNPTVAVLNSIIRQTNFTSDTLRVLSHALPVPSLPGHSYKTLLDNFQRSCPISQVFFVHLMHALVREDFSPDHLPPSAPTTPGPAFGGLDYFTAKVFNNAVSTTDYSQRIPSQPLSAGLVPSGSIHMSIVERYIPPTNTQELANMFNAHSRSLLVDRLLELSPDNGCLTFIYPTRTGAETFSTDFIGTVIDPVLRQTVLVNNFSMDLAQRIGTMRAIRRMHDFAALKQAARRLCSDMAAVARTPFTLAHSESAVVPIAREMLAGWYLKQEKRRIRAAVEDYMEGYTQFDEEVLSMYGREPNAGVYHAGAITTQLLQDMESNVDSAPAKIGIEVAVLVIKRSREAAQASLGAGETRRRRNSVGQ